MPTSIPFVWILESWQWTLSQGLLIVAAVAIRGAVPAVIMAGVVSWLTRHEVPRVVPNGSTAKDSCVSSS
jgi:hypothetical protein